jgi:hypothetical protein
VAAASLGPFEELYAWKQLDFQFPNAAAREAAIASGDLIQKNNLPVGIEVWEDKLFVTVPRWKKGVPANLNYISLSNTIGKKNSNSSNLSFLHCDEFVSKPSTLSQYLLSDTMVKIFCAHL